MAATNLNRWVPLTEAIRRLPGRKEAVAAWLRSRGLVRRLPWGTQAVDIEAAYARLSLESVPVEPPRPGAEDLDAIITSAPVAQVERPRRGRRPRAAAGTMPFVVV